MQKSTNQISTFSEHGSFLIISGAIHATVPVNVILALFSESSLQVPKSDILMMSLYETNMLQTKDLSANLPLLIISNVWNNTMVLRLNLSRPNRKFYSI